MTAQELGHALLLAMAILGLVCIAVAVSPRFAAWLGSDDEGGPR
jgi:hypothetical protein